MSAHLITHVLPIVAPLWLLYHFISLQKCSEFMNHILSYHRQVFAVFVTFVVYMDVSSFHHIS